MLWYPYSPQPYRHRLGPMRLFPWTRYQRPSEPTSLGLHIRRNGSFDHLLVSSHHAVSREGALAGLVTGYTPPRGPGTPLGIIMQSHSAKRTSSSPGPWWCVQAGAERECWLHGDLAADFLFLSNDANS